MQDPDSYSDYQKLWEHVCWSYPLISYHAPSNSIDLGPICAESDEHDYSPAPMFYWYKEFDSGLKVVLQRPQDDHDRYPFIHVYANKPLIDELIAELSIPLQVDWRTDAHSELWHQVLQHFSNNYCYAVYRLDDNNNEFLVESGLTEEGAQCMAFRFERKGHKQAYFVKKLQS